MKFDLIFVMAASLFCYTAIEVVELFLQYSAAPTIIFGDFSGMV